METFSLLRPPTVVGDVEHFDRDTALKQPLPDTLTIPTRIEAADISIVIAVKNNQSGIDRFLLQLSEIIDLACYPREVIIVDNNSDVPITLNGDFPFPVVLTQCERKGPAAARNEGVAAARGRWILFTDSDCVPADSFIAGYLGYSRACVAFAGAVKLVGDDILTRYYREQNIFIPLALSSPNGIEPWSIVTANCLVLKAAIEAVGGFDEQFVYAGGEDSDLGVRLRKVGGIRYQFNSISLHEIDDGLQGFASRFIRYGLGHKQLSKKYPDFFELTAVAVNNPTPLNRVLASIHLNAMLWGLEGRSFQNFPLIRYMGSFEAELSALLI